jgi:replicative DNA helicase
VRDKALLRGLIRVSREILDEAYDSPDEARHVIDRAEQSIFEIAQQQITGHTSSIQELLQETFELLQEHEGKAIIGLASGFGQLDELTAGFQNGELVILAARPSMGKTALLLNVAEYMSVIDKRPVVLFSLEMSKMQITQRLLASHAQFNLRNLRRTTISPEAWTNLQAAAGELEQAPLLIDDSSTLTSLQLRAKARRLKAQYDIQCVLVDYLQLMTYYGRADSRQEQIAEMSRSLKALARELDIPVICAAQLNSGPADRPTHVPRMSDLRESGSIEQDADVVALLHNEDYYHIGEDSYEPSGVTKLIIEKQRNGPTGTVDLIFRKDCTRFEQSAPGYMAPHAAPDTYEQNEPPI